jgi:2,4-dienoyl-CoA reductase-like NADH-dependent reductase (Old Yellow Enzyme family)
MLSPLRIGPVTSRNRIVFGAHFTMFSEPNETYGEPGYYGARIGRYAGERAAGGVGVVIVGHTHVHPSTAYSMRNNAMAWTDETVTHFRNVVKPIHDQGALAFIQLSHSGAKSSADWSAYPLLAASHMAINSEAPKVLERHEIADIVEHFARSAKNAVDGGFDGVEVQGAHLYLINEFLSPNYNHRDDEYGGTFQNRMRFAVEVLTAVRARVGPAVAVGMRLVGDEQAQDGSGVTAEGAGEIARYLEDRGLVDFIDVSVSQYGELVQPMYSPHLLGVYAAAAVKRAVASVPVFAVHRIVTPDEAEGVLAREEADAITLVRPLIADPQWVEKARAGRAAQIRRCTGCNQLCYGNLYRSLPVQCVTNPAVGRESQLGAGTLVPAARPRRVVVIGGGPGGLEAAWVAAARGHEVVLLERASQLGGKIRLAQLLPGRDEIRDFADWRVGECERHGVDIRLGVEADLDTVLSIEPDAVVVATGGTAGLALDQPGLAPVTGLDHAFVLDHEAAVLTVDSLGERVLIVDVVGHIEGVGLAEMVAATGRQVTLSSPLASPVLLDQATAKSALRRACRAGAVWRPNTRLLAVDQEKSTLLDLLSAGTDAVGADSVVIRAHGRPSDALYHALRGAGPEVVRVGDAVAVRPADRAIFEGHVAAREL